MDYIIQILVFSVIYAMLALSLRILVRQLNLISLAQSGFFGIGAYSSVLLSQNLELPFIVSLILAIVICVIFAFVIGSIALRTVEDYFVIITLGIQIIAFSVMNNWVSLTNGPFGITNIPYPSMFGLQVNNQWSLLLLCLFLFGFIYYVVQKMTNSPLGTVALAIKEDEIYALSVGKSVYRVKMLYFVVSSGLAAIPGVFYAHYISYIDPQTFSLKDSIFVLSIVILSSNKSISFVLLISILLHGFPEVLRFVGFPSSIAGYLQNLFYGLLIIMFLFFQKNLKERL